MKQAPLLTFHDLTVRTAEGLNIGPINWTVHRAQRIWMECGDEGMFAAFAEVLAGLKRPASGYLEELGTVTVQSDFRLRESLKLNQSIEQYLHSSDAPEFVWLENRRRSLNVLLDRIGLTPNRLRLPLKLQPVEVFNKFWALRFLVSRADLLIGRELFALPDPQIRESLRMRWGDFHGTLLAVAAHDELAGEPDAHVVLASDGRFSSRPLPGGQAP